MIVVCIVCFDTNVLLPADRTHMDSRAYKSDTLCMKHRPSRVVLSHIHLAACVTYLKWE